MNRKYIDDLGIKFEDTPQGFCNEEFLENVPGTRGEYWHKERAIYGFDNRETWSLDYAIKLYLYERLCMYNEVNCIDTEFHKFKYKGEELSQQQCIDRMIEGLKLDLTLSDLNEKRFKDENIKSKINDVFPILALCINSLWW